MARRSVVATRARRAMGAGDMGWRAKGGARKGKGGEVRGRYREEEEEAKGGGEGEEKSTAEGGGVREKKKKKKKKKEAKAERLYFEIEAIRKKRTRQGEVQYLIKWLGWPESGNTWEPYENVKTCVEILRDFEEGVKLRHLCTKAKRGITLPDVEGKSCVQNLPGGSNYAQTATRLSEEQLKPLDMDKTSAPNIYHSPASKTIVKEAEDPLDFNLHEGTKVMVDVTKYGQEIDPQKVKEVESSLSVSLHPCSEMIKKVQAGVQEAGPLEDISQSQGIKCPPEQRNYDKILKLDNSLPHESMPDKLLPHFATCFGNIGFLKSSAYIKDGSLIQSSLTCPLDIASPGNLDPDDMKTRKDVLDEIKLRPKFTITTPLGIQEHTHQDKITRWSKNEATTSKGDIHGSKGNEFLSYYGIRYNDRTEVNQREIELMDDSEHFCPSGKETNFLISMKGKPQENHGRYNKIVRWSNNPGALRKEDIHPLKLSEIESGITGGKIHYVASCISDVATCAKGSGRSSTDMERIRFTGAKKRKCGIIRRVRPILESEQNNLLREPTESSDKKRKLLFEIIKKDNVQLVKEEMMNCGDSAILQENEGGIINNKEGIQKENVNNQKDEEGGEICTSKSLDGCLEPSAGSADQRNMKHMRLEQASCSQEEKPFAIKSKEVQDKKVPKEGNLVQLKIAIAAVFSDADLISLKENTSGEINNQEGEFKEKNSNQGMTAPRFVSSQEKVNEKINNEEEEQRQETIDQKGEQSEEVLNKEENKLCTGKSGYEVVEAFAGYADESCRDAANIERNEFRDKNSLEKVVQSKIIVAAVFPNTVVECQRAPDGDGLSDSHGLVQFPKTTGVLEKAGPLYVKEIMKAISFNSSVINGKQEVVVLFKALRSDGKEVLVDNKFMRSSYPHLLLNFYEQNLRYGCPV